MTKGQKGINFGSIIGVITILGAFLYLFLAQGPTTISAQDENKEVILPDGSQVTLHRQSELTYKGTYGKRYRKVILRGEGYFEIKHDPAKPFLVTNQQLNCRSLGGAFYINNDKEEPLVDVIAKRGKVAVIPNWSKEKNRIVINKGERAGVATDQQRVKKSRNDDLNYLAWKTKRFQFEQDGLDDVVAVLNHAFKGTINIKSAAISNCPVTATFQNQSLKAIIQNLTDETPIEATFTDNKILLSGDGC